MHEHHYSQPSQSQSTGNTAIFAFVASNSLEGGEYGVCAFVLDRRNDEDSDDELKGGA